MAAAAVTNMKKKVRDCKMFWESLAHQWAANYFLVRMVVPGTKPVETPPWRIVSKAQNDCVWRIIIISGNTRKAVDQ